MPLRIRYTLFFFWIFACSPLAAQFLVQTGRPTGHSWDAAWSVAFEGDAAFALVPDTSDLRECGLQVRILDADAETGSYFWAPASPGAPDAMPPGAVRILWENPFRALVRIEKGALTAGALPPRSWTRVHFSKGRPQAGIRPLRRPVPSSSTGYDGILDSVCLDSLLLTLEHLTGVKPYDIEGDVDSIKTRFSYSSGILKAQNYLRYRFLKMGYAATLDPFTLSSYKPAPAAFAPGQPERGWCCIENHLFSTCDGGKTWHREADIPLFETQALYAVDDRILLCIGAGGTIYRSSDAGASWVKAASRTDGSLFGIHFEDSRRGWICGDGVLLSTLDGGRSWERSLLTCSAGRLYDLFFLDGKGWAAGANGAILASTDGGRTWEDQVSGTQSRLTSIRFTDALHGWAAGWKGTLLETRDGGKTWLSRKFPESVSLTCVRFRDAETGAAGGLGGMLLLTRDGGRSWERAETGTCEDILSVSFLEDGSIRACTRNGILTGNSAGSGWDFSALVNLNNVVAVKTGTLHPESFVILCAHYDSISETPYSLAPGADDNASGCAAVVEAARILKNIDTDFSVQFVLFAAEEQGMVGSEAYAAKLNQAGASVIGVINMDMIGYDVNGDNLMQIHMGYSGDSDELGEMIAANVPGWQLSLDANLLTTSSTTRSDHASFWTYGYPAVLLIEDMAGDMNAYYHTRLDQVAFLNLPYFREMSRLAIGSAAMLAGADTTTAVPADGPQPARFALYTPYPNPFNPSVTLRYTLPASAPVHLTLFDVQGRTVRLLVREVQESGMHEAVWSGTDDSGRILPSGVYIVTLEFAQEVQTARVLFIR